GQPVGSMCPGARALPGRKKSFHVGSTPDVDDDPAHRVVRGRCHQYQISSWVDSKVPAARHKAWKAPSEGGLADRSRVQEDLSSACSTQLEGDRPDDCGTRRQLASRICIEQEASAVGVHQKGSRPAQSLGYKKRAMWARVCRGVELDELQVRHVGAG